MLLVAMAMAMAVAAAVAAAACAGAGGHESGAAPDLILINGRIFTGDAANPYVEALAIHGERISATGDTRSISALAGPATRRIDVGGHTVIAGINDAHNHLDIGPADVVRVETRSDDPSWSELRSALVTQVSSTPPGTLLWARFSLDIFNDTRVNRVALDAVSADHPIWLNSDTGHADILNTAALARAGIRDDIQNPMGGRYERDASGRLTGVIREYAALRLDRRFADAIPDAEAKRQLRSALERDARLGITTLQEMSYSLGVRRAVRLLSQVDTPIRLRIMNMALTTPAGRSTREADGLPRHPAPLITVSGIKWMTDGTPDECTFDARGQHANWRSQGVDNLIRRLPLTFSDSELRSMLREPVEQHDQLLLHIAGYPAASTMLRLMNESGGSALWAHQRVRFEHGDGLFPDLLPQVKALGIVVVQNPAHFSGFGEDTEKLSQPLRSLLEAGIPIALGSDGPVNPYLNIMLAVTHPNHHSEALSREQAVIAYTRGSAYAEFEEKELGTLEPGKLADLAVLSQDIFTISFDDLPKTTSLLTLVGGRTAYDAGVLGH